MLNLAIVLCTVFFTSATNVTFEVNTLKSIEDHVQQVIDGALIKVKQESDLIVTIAQVVADKLVNRTRDFNYKLINEVLLISANHGLTDFGMEVIGADITSCAQFSSNISDAAYSVINKTFICGNAQLDVRLNQVDAINKNFINAFANLTEIREEAKHCGDNVRDLESSYAAIACNRLAATNATLISEDIVKLMPFWITELQFLFNTYDLSLDYCNTKNGYLNFYRASVAAVNNTETCIQRIVSEFTKTEGVHVSFRSTTLETIQRHVQQVIDEAFSKVEKVSKLMETITQVNVENLENAKTDFNHEFKSVITFLLSSVNGKISDFATKAEDANITDCIQLSSNLENDAYSVINRTHKCANDELGMRLTEINDINNIFTLAFANLTNIRDAAQHCSDNVRDLESSYAAMSCNQLAESNATLVSAHIVKKSPLWFLHVNLSLDIYEMSLDICKFKNGYANLYRGSVANTHNTETCIQRITSELALNKTKALGASYQSDFLETSQRQIKKEITGAFTRVQEKSELIQEMTKKVVENIVDETIKFNKEVMDDVLNIVILANRNIEDLFTNVKDTNIIAQCGQLSRHLVDDVYVVIEEMQKCANTQQNIILNKIDSIDKTFIEVFANLTATRMRVHQCDNNVWDMESSYIALSCMQLGAFSATSISENIVELSLSWMEELNVWLDTFEPSLSDCKEANLHFYRKMSAVLSITETCIQRMTDEAVLHETAAKLRL